MKRHEVDFELITEEVKGQNHKLHVVLHPKEKLDNFYCGYALAVCLLGSNQQLFVPTALTCNYYIDCYFTLPFFLVIRTRIFINGH